MDDTENQAEGASGENVNPEAIAPTESAPVIEDAPAQKASSAGTVGALIFVLLAFGFAAYMFFFKDMDPISGKAKAMIGKSHAEVVKALGPPTDTVEAGVEFQKKYPNWRFTPEPYTGEGKILVYVRGKWTIFLFMDYDDNLHFLQKCQNKPEGIDEEDISASAFPHAKRAFA